MVLNNSKYNSSNNYYTIMMMTLAYIKFNYLYWLYTFHNINIKQNILLKNKNILIHCNNIQINVHNN